MRKLRTFGKIAAIAAVALVGASAVFTQVARVSIEASIPQDGTRIAVNGTMVHYVERGNGRPIVLIHGLMANTRSFSPDLVEQLAQEHKVILVDRPGAGYSDPLPADRNTLAAQADIIAGMIEALSLDAPLVVGHSLGGAVALTLALDHPELVGGLALIAPAARPRPQSREDPFNPIDIAPDVLRRVLSITLATPLGLAVFDSSAAGYFAPEPLPESFRTEGGGLLSLRPVSYFSGGGDLHALRQELPALSDRYETLDMPVDVLFGVADLVTPLDWHGPFLRDTIPGATLATIEGGHMIIYTAPRLVADWIAENASN